MNLKHKNMPLQIKSIDESGTFSGYGSVFDVVDKYHDAVRKGAFLNSLNAWQAKGKLPPMLWQHDTKQPIGYFTKMYEDDHGLYVEGKLLIDDVPQAKTAYALLKNNVLGGLSIGYNTLKGEILDAGETWVYELHEIDLWEVSLVTFPANESATVDNVKNTLPNAAQLAEHLQCLGFSPDQAKQVAEHGLSSLKQADDTEQSILNAIKILQG